jgi:hypothetical protein
MATVVAVITSMVVANAAQTFTTPNSVNISYNLAAGANSAVITPATNRSVLVMGCCTTLGAYATGQVSLLHIPGTIMAWVGLESYSGGAVTQNATSGPVAHIVYIDFNHKVDIQMASVDTILIHNGNTATRAGNVTLVW